MGPNRLMKKMRKFKSTCLWHRLNQKEGQIDDFRRVLFLAQLLLLLGFVQDCTQEGDGPSRALTRGVGASTQSFPEAQVYCSPQHPNARGTRQSSFCAAPQGRSLFTSALALNPPGSSGLSFPDKLGARMWGLGVAPNLSEISSAGPSLVA